jgi:hypothetical protein
MKTFHFELGHEDFSTLTVGELKAILDKFPDEMPVLATWEGIYTPFRAQRGAEVYFEVVTPKHWLESDNVPCLVFDVDNY